MKFSHESLRRAVLGLLVAPAVMVTLALFVPGESARSVCLRVAAFLLLAAGVAIVAYLLRFGKGFLVFLTKRLCVMLVTLVGVTMITFVVLRLAPGDPVSGAAGFHEMAQDALDIDQRDIVRARDELLGSLARYTYSARAIDPDGDPVRLEVDWGDETPPVPSAPVSSGTKVEQVHAWSAAGDYEVRVRAIDEHGARSPWSPPLSVAVQQGDSPPPAPTTPRGSAAAKVGQRVAYTVASRDRSEGVGILIDWGDGTTRTLVRRLGSDGERTRDHLWFRAGVFAVRARAVRDDGAVSRWSTPREVVVYDAESPLAPPRFSAAKEWSPPHEPLTFTARTFSRTGADVRYRLYVREERAPPDESSPPVATREAPSGRAVELSHSFPRPGEYRVHVSVAEVDADSAPRRSHEVAVTVDGTNRPPLLPEPPKGPERVRVETTLLEQYVHWLTRVTTLDFGRSYHYGREVWPLIWKERLPKTLILSALSLFLAYLIAIPIGVYSSTHRDTFVDRCLSAVLFTLYSLPSFWVGAMLIVLMVAVPSIPISGFSCSDPSAHRLGPAAQVPLLGLCLAGLVGTVAARVSRSAGHGRGVSTALGWMAGICVACVSFLYLPANGITTGILFSAVPLASAVLVLTGSVRSRTRLDRLRAPLGAALATLFLLVLTSRLLMFDLFWHALLPVICLTYGGLAVLSRYARSGMLEVVRQDYIRTARAKGLPERTVIFKHALRNGLIPILTLFATVFPQLISGSVIVETIFNVEGMGLLIVNSVERKDYNVIMAVTTLTAIMTMLGLLVSDVLYVIVDPRISFEKRALS